MQDARRETSQLVACGPFGAVRELCNVGESLFHTTHLAYERGAVKLTAGGLDFSTLVYYPPGCEASGEGRVLLCSNYHWLCDGRHWMGGFFGSHEGGRRLLLNLVAGAVAARVRLPGTR